MIPEIFDSGLKLVFTAANGEQRVNRICEAHAEDVVRLGPKSIRTLRPIKLVFLTDKEIQKRQAPGTDASTPQREQSFLAPE